MLLVGTCNPTGENSTYNGLYYKQEELQEMVKERLLHDIPVKTEHTGSEIGRVVSSFIDDRGALQCIMEVDDSTVEGAIAAGFVKAGIAADLSLGYTVDVQQTHNKLKAGAKRILEISLVRRGARRGCHVSAYQEIGKTVVYHTPIDQWSEFDMT